MTLVERITPLLVYRDLPAAHDFLVAAFGFEPLGVNRDRNGEPVHAEVGGGGTTIWLHRVADEQEMMAVAAGPTSSGLVIAVSDADEHCDRAKKAGAFIARDPEDMPYGQREYEARDPEGHRWWFASSLR